MQRTAWSPAALRQAVALRQPTLFARVRLDRRLAQLDTLAGSDYFLRPSGPRSTRRRGCRRRELELDPSNALCQLRGDRAGASSKGCAACRGEAAYQRPWRNVTLAHFFRSLQLGRKAIYFSPIEREFAGLAHDVDFSCAGSSGKTGAGRPAAAAWRGRLSFTHGFGTVLTYVWLGANDVTTQCHYDLSHNVHAVLAGQKTFILTDAQSHRSYCSTHVHTLAAPSLSWPACHESSRRRCCANARDGSERFNSCRS